MRLITAIVPAVLLACAPGADRSGTDPLDPESLDPETVLALSGQVSGGAGHALLVVDGPTSATWQVSLDEDGRFSETLPAGRYALALLDAAQRPVALYADGGETLHDLTGEVDLGVLEADTEARTLTATTSGASRRRGGDLDLSDLSGVQTDKNKSGGNGVDVTTLAGSDGDADGDGVPDFLDNDSNENGIYDTAEGRTTCTPRLASLSDDPDAVPQEAWEAVRSAQCAFFDNLKLSATAVGGSGDGDVLPHTAEHTLAAHYAAPDALLPYIDTVEVIALPGYADADVGRAAGGWSFTDYPTAGDAWSDHGYEMPLATGPMGEKAHSIWIDTDGDPHPAIYQLAVTLTDGSVINYTTRVFFVFNTPPRLSAMADGTGDLPLGYPMVDGDLGSSSAPLPLDGSGAYTIFAYRPLDAAGGSEICGMDVSAEIFYESASGSQLNTTVVNTPRLPDTASCDPTTAVSVDIDADDLPETYNGTDVARYRIAVMVSGPAGDNAATNLWAQY